MQSKPAFHQRCRLICHPLANRGMLRLFKALAGGAIRLHVQLTFLLVVTNGRSNKVQRQHPIHHPANSFSPI